MQRKSPVWSQLLSFFKLRNNTQKATRVVIGQAIKPQVDRRICIGQLFERINHISPFLCIIIRAPTLKNIVITSSVCLSVRPSTLSLGCNNLNSFLVTENWMFVYESSICLSICLSALLYAGIIGKLCYRKLSNLARVFIWVRSWSSSNLGHLGSVCPSVCLSVCPSVCLHFLCAGTSNEHP